MCDLSLVELSTSDNVWLSCGRLPAFRVLSITFYHYLLLSFYHYLLTGLTAVQLKATPDSRTRV